MTSDGRVWLITGAGRGLGMAFAQAALDAGDRVVATTRATNPLDDIAADHPQSLRVLALDVRDRNGARAAVDTAVATFGRLDVLVNNAGYGLIGAIEELSEADAREQLETNLLGTLWLTQAALPQMRAQEVGHIVQISTVGGVGSMPALGWYNASKWALEGYSEALAAEVAPFGIRVTIAELGGFDTDWAGSSMRFATPLPAYDPLREQLFGTAEVPWPRPAAETGDSAVADRTSGDDQPAAHSAGDDGAAQDGSPQIAAAALLHHLDDAEGPLRLLVGDDAPELVRLALERRREDYGKDGRFTWPGIG